MGERQLLALGCALTSLVASGLAQGPVYRERWGYLYLERLRAEVRNALPGRDAATRTKVADLLAEPAAGSPFAAPTKALALLRGVEADPAFVLRATMSAFLLPEICDPGAANETCRQLNASLFLPFTVVVPGVIRFEVEVRDRAGAVRFATTVVRDTEMADLRMGRPAAQVPCADLEDGTYTLLVRTLIDGAGPRQADVVLRMPFHVLRGYQARSEAALGKVRDLGPQLAPMARALLQGLAAEVSRAYLGEAPDGVSDAVGDLVRLEAGLENLKAGKHVLADQRGDVAAALPGTSANIACVLRIAEGRSPAASPAPRPLVVFAGGSPGYDLTASRPAAPASRGPRWLAGELPSFGKGTPWDVAFLDSPGTGRNYADEVRQAIKALRELWSVGDRPVVLVCDREAAAVVGLQFQNLGLELGGLVLIGGGAMPGPTLDKLGPLPVRIGMLHRYPSSEGLRRANDYVELGRREQRWQGDFARLSDQEPAWPFGLSAFADAIAAFLVRVQGS